MLQSKSNSTAIIPVIVFRGTDNIEDWMKDVDHKLVKSKFINAPSDVKIHHGFQNALFQKQNHDDGTAAAAASVAAAIHIVQDIEMKIVDLIGEDGELIVTGHSLG